MSRPFRACSLIFDAELVRPSDLWAGLADRFEVREEARIELLDSESVSSKLQVVCSGFTSPYFERGLRLVVVRVPTAARGVAFAETEILRIRVEVFVE